MKTIIRNSDSRAIHAGNDITLTDAVRGEGWIDRNFNTTNATLVDAELPANWFGGVWAYSGGVWSIADQAGYDAAYAATLPTLADYDAALTARLDAEAQTHRYADRISCSVRAGYPGPFQAEGIAFAQWMDAQNAKGYQVLSDFQKGLISQPTIKEFLAELDPMVWPA